MAERILVTGASGFVGRAVCRLLIRNGYRVRGAVRGGQTLPDGVDPLNMGNIAEVSQADWGRALEGVNAVVHCAAVVHQMSSGVSDDSATFQAVNTLATVKLAEAALSAGVKRFVFVSTIKVLAEQSKPGCPLTWADTPMPADAYSRSKYEAEKGLQAMCANTNMDLVIIRPPLVYGPGVGANFKSLMKVVGKRYPLPLGAIHNRRSMLSVDNLADLVGMCVAHKAPIQRVLLASDGDDVSTPELIRRIGKAMGVSPLLIPVPVSWLMAAATLIGKRAAVVRLCGNLQVDISATRDALNWSPRFTMADTLSRMVSLNGKGII